MLLRAEGGSYGIAADMAQSIAVNVLSDQAINLTDPLFQALGIKSDSDIAAKYFQQVMSELTTIEGDLTKITTKLQSISSGISAIETQLTAISSLITDAELQTQLTQYAENANVIEQNYQTYAAALAGMANESTFEESTNTLFSLFATNNVDTIATAMRNIRDLLVGAGELRGIISYQGAEVERVWADYSADPTHLLTYTYPKDNPFGPKDPHQWLDEFPDGCWILNALPTVLTEAFDSTVIPTLKAAMAIALKGFSLLCAAWGGTINESNLQTPVAGIGDVVAAMRGLFETIDLDAIGANVMQTTGPRLPDAALSAVWYNDEDEDDQTCPANHDWLFWRIDPPDPAAPVSFGNRLRSGVVQTPWQYGGVAALWVSQEGAIFQRSDGTWITTAQYSSYAVPKMNIPRPSAMGVTQPANLATFLSTLPTAPPAEWMADE
jgi:hypothetical protein